MEKKYAIFEVKNHRATQTSAPMFHHEVREFYDRLMKADNADAFDSTLEIREVGA